MCDSILDVISDDVLSTTSTARKYRVQPLVIGYTPRTVALLSVLTNSNKIIHLKPISVLVSAGSLAWPKNFDLSSKVLSVIL
jgi:hypothetical protein